MLKNNNTNESYPENDTTLQNITSVPHFILNAFIYIFATVRNTYN